MLHLQNIHQAFSSGDSTLKVVDGLNLVIPKGEFLCIIGSNGSGKSTLLNIIAGNQKPDNGTITINGTDITGLQDFERSKWLARIFQDPFNGTAPELTILENMRLASRRTSSKNLTIGTGADFRKLTKDHLSILGLGLENKIDQPVGSLSGGQRQALTLVMAALAPAEVLLMDEPTAALDPKTAAMIMEITNKLHAQFGFTVVMVTHNIKDAVNMGNRLLMLKSGTVFKDIPAAEKRNLDIVDVVKWFD